MKKTNLNPAAIRGIAVVTCAIAQIKKITSVLMLTTALCFMGCSKNESGNRDVIAVSHKSKAFVSTAQPLPQGKANFSVTMGNFDTSGRTWERIINWTFNATAGTVAGTSWTWFSDVKTGYAAFAGGSHYCNLGYGAPGATCTSDAPSGWNAGASIHQSWVGSYTYNTTTHVLDITWATIDGVATTATDSWDVTLPESGLARVNLINSNYTLTHGRGYGSNAAWTVFKNISQIVAAGLPNFSGPNGKNVRANGNASSVTIYPSGAGQWNAAAWSIAGSTTPSTPPTPATTLHQWIQGPLCSPLIANGGTCAVDRGGSVQHFTVSGTNRQVAYSLFCACLPAASTWPCYNGNKHAYAMQQIIDDSGTLKAYIGVEFQNMPGSSGFQMQCMDFSNIP